MNRAFQNKTGVWLTLTILVFWACFLVAAILGGRGLHGQNGEGEGVMQLSAAQSQQVRKVVLESSVYGNPLHVLRGVDNAEVLWSDAPLIALHYDKSEFDARLDQPFAWEVQGDTMYIRQPRDSQGWPDSRYKTISLHVPAHVKIVQGLAIRARLETTQPLPHVELHGSVVSVFGARDKDHVQRKEPNVRQLVVRAINLQMPRDDMYNSAYAEFSEDLKLEQLQLSLAYGHADLKWHASQNSAIQLVSTPESSVDVAQVGLLQHLQMRTATEQDVMQWRKELQAIAVPATAIEAESVGPASEGAAPVHERAGSAPKN